MDLSNPVTAIIPSLEGQALGVLARTTMPLSGSATANLCSGSNPGIRQALARLVRQGTVHARRSGPSVLYTANREHILWDAIEAAITSASLAEHNLIERIENAVRLHFPDPAAHHTLTLALYGSVARGTSTLESDIDLVLVHPSEHAAQAEALVDTLTEKVEAWTGNPCNVYSLTPERLSELEALNDPMLDSWTRDSTTLVGEDLRQRIEDAHSRHGIRRP